MKIVQIIAGGYGHRPKVHAPAKLIMAGEFVCLDDAEADRLVQQGVAVYGNRTRKPARSWNRQMPTAMCLNRSPQRRTNRPAERPARPPRSNGCNHDRLSGNGNGRH